MNAVLNWMPLGLVFVGAVLAAVGSLWLGIRQNRNGAQSSDAAQTTARILQDMSARSGNEKDKNELIELRTRLLQAERRSTPDVLNVMNEIAARVPQNAADFKKREQDNKATVATLTTEYELRWEPTIRFFISEFDRLVADAVAKGFQIETQTKTDKIQLAVAAPVNPQPETIRFAAIGRLGLDLRYRPARLYPSGYQSGHLSIQLIDAARGDQGMTSLGMGGDTCSGLTAKVVTVPKDGMAPVELTNAITTSIAKSLEELLTRARAESDAH